MSNDISKTVKDSVTMKYFSGVSALMISKEFGVSKTSIYKWVRAAIGNNMNNDNQNISSKNLKLQEKLQILKETHNMADEDKAKYCRKHGIYTTDLDVFEKDILSSLNNKNNLQEIAKLRKQNKDLTNELSKKDKALSSTAALLILKKKADLLWGEDKED